MLTPQQRIIRARLMERGLTMAGVAKRLRVSRTAITRVVSGESRSRRIEHRICQYIGLPWASVFPPFQRRHIRLQRQPKRGRSVYLILE